MQSGPQVPLQLRNRSRQAEEVQSEQLLQTDQLVHCRGIPSAVPNIVKKMKGRGGWDIYEFNQAFDRYVFKVESPFFGM